MARTRSATRTRAASIRRWRTSCNRSQPTPCGSTSARVFDLAAVALRAHAGGDVLLVLAHAIELALRCAVEVDDIAARLGTGAGGRTRRERRRRLAQVQIRLYGLRCHARLLPALSCTSGEQDCEAGDIAGSSHGCHFAPWPAHQALD